MLTKGDIADIIAERLGLGADPSARKPAKAPAKKVFISDWELRRAFKQGQKTIKVPANAIISPLSEDWLDYQGIRIVRD